MKVLLIFFSILCSAAAQVALRQAGGYAHFHKAWFVWFALSALAYGLSFLMYAVLLRWYPISQISPLLTVGVMLVVVCTGIVLGETLAVRQWLGVLLGVASIILIVTK